MVKPIWMSLRWAVPPRTQLIKSQLILGCVASAGRFFGGSSAVASGECTVAIGSDDTARSVNLPLFCGGAKTNLWASVPVWFSCLCFIFDQIGPFGRTVEDAAIYWVRSQVTIQRLNFKVDIPDYTQSLNPTSNQSESV